MIKYLMLLPLFWCIAVLHAQVPGNSDMDDNPILSPRDADILRPFLKYRQDTSTLSGMKVAFVSGSSGKLIVSKSHFFKHDLPISPRPLVSVVLLTNDEKKESGGYQAILYAWVKVHFGKQQRKKLVSKLQSQTDRY